MKKQTVVLVWSAVLLLLVAVGCICAYYFWSGGQTENVTTVAFNCVSTDIEYYTVTDRETHYTIEKSQSGWKVKNASDAELDQDKVGKLISSISNITATGTVSRSDFDKLYTKAEKRVTLKLKDSEETEIRFLGVCDGMCAFKVSGNKKIYVMNASMLDVLVPSLDSLRVTAVFANLANTDTLPDYYKYKDYDGSIIEVRTKNSTELANGKGNRYIMESPYAKEVDDDSFEQQIALKIPTINIKRFVEGSGLELSDYGLDESSRAELVFKWDGNEESMFLGKTENGVVYAVKAGDNEIFAIETGMLEFLHLDPFYILESHILKSVADQIASLEFTIDDMVYTVSSEERDGKNPRFQVCGKTATLKVFETVIDELEDIELLSELNDIPNETEDIVIVVKYDNGANEQKISFIKLNNNYAAFVDGKAEFVVDGQSVAEFVKEVENAYNNPMRTE